MAPRVVKGDTVILEVYQGETYRALVTEYDEDGVTPISNAGHSAKMQIRTGANASGVIAELTDTAGLALGGEDGTIGIRLTAQQTTRLINGAVFDLRLISTNDPGEVRYPVAGTIRLLKRVTR